MEMLDYDQWLAITEAKSRGILAMRTGLIPKWLVHGCQRTMVYQWDYLKRAKVKIQEVTKSSIFLEQWGHRWSIKRGGPQVGSMNDAIVELSGHGYEFITDVLIYVISTCVMENANRLVIFMCRSICSIGVLSSESGEMVPDCNKLANIKGEKKK
ncbi:hypothetical protein Cgig2_009136 [Carnegiea gigantea]|uniref:Uncharacterized protein n=1 Tax=Carnegiea gigantea TaxID=171969 RepID=A0A9Q1Q9D4_9CARY|nr:hypothetical protein Cgig2_009136 [Carnegiea gigantea]